MITGRAALQGGVPEVITGAGNPEAEKYGRLWATPEYRAVAPGEGLASVFLQHARPRRGAEILDFGCGTGRGALMLAILGGVKVTMIDFVRNCLDSEIQQALTTQPHALAFIKADLEQPIPAKAMYGFCTDVMEHIPTDRVDRVLTNILKAAQHVFFSIATTEDKCGALIGEPLHLTVQPYGWWLKKLMEQGCVVHWSRRDDKYCCFYVSAWSSGMDVVHSGVLNAEEEAIRANVRHNIAQGWKQVHPHEPNDLDCMIVGGGPSLAQFEDEIRAHRAAGVKLLTLNGAYNWALERGLAPSAQIMVDARPFNARFTKPVHDTCTYLIASQCDPTVFDGLPPERTFLFHTMPGLVEDLLTAQYGDEWHVIPGGSTVLLRTIPLMRMLGYRRFHLYGCDSCLTPDPTKGWTLYRDGLAVVGETGGPMEFSESDATRLATEDPALRAGPILAHHAYAQPENDKPPALPVTTNPGGRIFYAHGWMISQAQEMMDLIRVFGDEIELEIHGDGLLAYMLRTGAQMTYDDEAAARAHAVTLT